MEDPGNRKPVLVLLNGLSNNVTDHLLTIFKSLLIFNVKRFYHSNPTNLIFRIGEWLYYVSFLSAGSLLQADIGQVQAGSLLDIRINVRLAVYIY